MSCVHSYLAKSNVNRDSWTYTERDHVQVSEIWTHKTASDDQFSQKNLTLKQHDLLEFLRKDRMVKSNQQDARLIHRFIWIPRIVSGYVANTNQSDLSRVLDIKEEFLESLLTETGHKIAFQTCETILSGAGTVRDTPQNQSTHYITLMPKFAMTWSASSISDCITTICTADESKIRSMEDMIQQQFLTRLSAKLSLPVLLAAILFSQEIDRVHESLKQEIRRVEVRTGHHSWRSRTEQPALGDLMSLAAKMSGCSSRAASCLRKQQTLRRVLQFGIGQQEQKYLSRSEDAVGEILLALQTAAEAQQIDYEFIKHRNHTQLDALFHLVAQKDAASAQEMAQDSRIIASATRRDSASMNGIAILTMLFLPGTFIASLLGIPLFDWDSKTVDGIYRSEYYRPVVTSFLVMAVPATLVVFLIWLVWVALPNLLDRKRAGKTFMEL